MDEPKVGDVWYRYMDDLRIGTDEYDRAEMRVSELTCSVLSVTPKGVWVADDTRSKYGIIRNCYGWIQGKRFILKHATARYAYPTKEMALESYVARKKRQISILSTQIKTAKDALAIANLMLLDPTVKPYVSIKG